MDPSRGSTCARVLLDADAAFVFEDPGYLMARRCFEATGGRLLPAPVDAQGLDTGRLPEDPSVRLAYVINVGTFSKALSPQMRLGYLVLPLSLVGAFRQAKRLTDRHAPVLEQRVLAWLIDSGAYERHVRRIRRVNERRRAALLDAIARWMPNAHMEGTAAGLHVVVWLPWLGPGDEPAVIEAARQRGVGVHLVSGLYVQTGHRRESRPAGFVVGYASLGVAVIERGIRGWSQAMEAPPARR